MANEPSIPQGEARPRNNQHAWLIPFDCHHQSQAMERKRKTTSTQTSQPIPLHSVTCNSSPLSPFLFVIHPHPFPPRLTTTFSSSIYTNYSEKHPPIHPFCSKCTCLRTHFRELWRQKKLRGGEGESDISSARGGVSGFVTYGTPSRGKWRRERKQIALQC